MTLKTIDLNADLGESFGPWKMGADEQMLEIVTSANVACGFHAGDPLVMTNTVQACVKNAVRIGAHPGFDDLNGFGRRRMADPDHRQVAASIVYQVGALAAIAVSCDAQVTHVKLHGALANMASEDKALAQCFVGAVQSFNPSLAIVAMAATPLQSQAEKAGAVVLREVYADRAYNDDGTLVSRNLPGAVIHDPAAAADRVLEMIETQSVTSVNGVRVPVKPETVCVHGDNKAAVMMAAELRNAIEAAGVSVGGY